MRQRRAEGVPDEPRDFLDALLSDGARGLADDAIVGLLTVVLRASHGVPGCALTWAARQFAIDPIVLDRVRAEGTKARAARSGIPVEPSELPYTEALVKELLRMYPPTWLMGRQVAADTTLGQWRLRRDEQVMISTYHVHRDPRHWEKPEEFRPERWLRTERPHTRHAYFPFGAGPRICLGNQVGMMQLVLAIAWLADTYDVEVANLERGGPLPKPYSCRGA